MAVRLGVRSLNGLGPTWEWRAAARGVCARERSGICLGPYPMSPDEAIAAAASGKLLPVYLLLGEERWLRNAVLAALRARATEGAVPGFNEDEFTAGESSAGSVLGAARTLPMMARTRWVLVRSLERWEARASDEDAEGDAAASGDAAESTSGKGALDQLAAYAGDPSSTTVLVLCAEKLNTKRRLVTAAKKGGFFVDCAPPSKKDLPAWVRNAARRRGHAINASTAELLVELTGPDLATMDDVLERLSLFVGAGAELTEEALCEMVPVIRPATVWELVDAIGRRDRKAALSLLDRVYDDPQDRGLRLVGTLAWSTRQLLRLRACLAEGLRGGEAAKAAGVPPFRQAALEQQLRRLPEGALEEWLVRLRDVDFALKGGSKRPARAILECALIELCSQ